MLGRVGLYFDHVSACKMSDETAPLSSGMVKPRMSLISPEH